MSKPVAGDAIAFLCICVIRDMRRPFDVELISKSEEAFGIVVPIPAAPVDGNVFVCACTENAAENKNAVNVIGKNLVFIIRFS